MKGLLVSIAMFAIAGAAEAQSLGDALWRSEIDSARQQLQYDRDALSLYQNAVPYDSRGNPRPDALDQTMIEMRQRALDADIDRIDGLLRNNPYGSR